MICDLFSILCNRCICFNFSFIVRSHNSQIAKEKICWRKIPMSMLGNNFFKYFFGVWLCDKLNLRQVEQRRINAFEMWWTKFLVSYRLPSYNSFWKVLVAVRIFYRQDFYRKFIFFFTGRIFYALWKTLHGVGRPRLEFTVLNKFKSI